jgi:anaerobic selenocysteine-containing dehydrogenase
MSIDKPSIKFIKGYCPQCMAICGTIAQVEDGVFTKVLPDKEHPNFWPSLCPKGHAGPELVYSNARLRYPMRRTRPKGDPNPGWERISWDEALDIIAAKLNEIKAKYGAEAVGWYRPAPGGSASKDFWDWMLRIAHAYGSPNTIATTHICNWGRDGSAAHTFGTMVGPRPEADKSGCILVWGANPYRTWPILAGNIEQGIKKGARLIVVDPRRTEIAEKADLWLQVNPGTDCALVLGMLHVAITEKLYDERFVLDWTNAPFLVRTDTTNLLRASNIAVGADTKSYVVWDKNSHSPKVYDPRTTTFESESLSPALTGSYTVGLADGKQVECKTVFQLLDDRVSQYPLGWAESITNVPRDKIREAAEMFTTIKPSCYWTWNGIEQQTNDNQTHRTICILYSLTGNFDAIGGNRVFPSPPIRRLDGTEFLTAEAKRKRLGNTERPIGPPGEKSRSYVAIRANDLYNAILTDKPYPVKGLVAFGGNVITSNPESLVGREAISKLDFFVQVEMFMTPPAQLADIVLPAASYWESWHVRVGFQGLGLKSSSHIQLREQVVPPQHESKSDMEIIFELAKRMGLGDKFWNGDMEAAYNYQIAPSGLTVAELRKHPSGITLDIPSVEKAYSRADPERGLPIGFNTDCKRIELFSQLFRDHNYEPIPDYREPVISDTENREGVLKRYPLILTAFKFLEYCHGWGRCLPSLRKLVPEPFIEINSVKAQEVGIKDGDMLILETANGKIKVKAKLTAAIAPNVVATQTGWWQECQELGLPGYDPYSPNGRNINLLYSTKAWDPVTGSYQLRGYPCAIRKI